MSTPATCCAAGLVLVTAAVSLAAQESRPTSKPTLKPAERMVWTGALSEKEFASLHRLKKGTPRNLKGKMVPVAKTKAYLSLPAGGKATAAVLVIHEWWGLNDHIKHWTDRLAADGYAALAVDLYGGVVATTRDGALKAVRAVDNDTAQATLKAALLFLRGPKIGAQKCACIGWCFGGGWSLKLAMADPDLDAAVIYYGRLVDDPTKLAGIRAPVLGIFGNQDRSIPRASIDRFEKAMKAAGKQVRTLRYDANHAFANPSSARYSQEHAAAAWNEVRVFLDRHLAAADRKGSFVAAGTDIGYVIPRAWGMAGKRRMRAVNLAVAEGIECYVTVLPGAAGGINDNLNRWRQQMGNEPLSEEEIKKLPQLQMIGQKAPLLVVNGSYRGMSGKTIRIARMMATVCPLDDATVFVKMIGPRKLVAQHEQAFRAFCRSMK